MVQERQFCMVNPGETSHPATHDMERKFSSRSYWSSVQEYRNIIKITKIAIFNLIFSGKAENSLWKKKDN